MCDMQAQVVLAFEQSLTNMTQRLQHLALTANKKVSRLKPFHNRPITARNSVQFTICLTNVIKFLMLSVGRQERNPVCKIHFQHAPDTGYFIGCTYFLQIVISL